MLGRLWTYETYVEDEDPLGMPDDLRPTELAMLLALSHRQGDSTPLSLDQERLLDSWVAGGLSPSDADRAAELAKHNLFAAERVLRPVEIYREFTTADGEVDDSAKLWIGRFVLTDVAMGEDGAALIWANLRNPGRSGSDNRRFVEAVRWIAADRKSLARSSAIRRQLRDQRSSSATATR